jgi:hypothetical protein
MKQINLIKLIIFVGYSPLLQPARKAVSRLSIKYESHSVPELYGPSRLDKWLALLYTALIIISVLNTHVPYNKTTKA